MRYGWREKVAANPVVTDADADEVSSVTDANISLTIAMNQAVTIVGHPHDGRQEKYCPPQPPYGADAYRRRQLCVARIPMQ